MKTVKTMNTAYVVICKDMTDEEYWVFEEQEEAEEWFRGAIKNELKRDDEKTDAQGRTIEECVNDWSADFGDKEIRIRHCNLLS